MQLLSFLQQAVNFGVHHATEQPPSETLTKALLDAEKTAKKVKPHYTPEQLQGTWRLCFITGTKKAQKQAEIVLKSGRYLPSWAKIELTYQTKNESIFPELDTLTNSIECGGFHLILAGPAKFINIKNILAFDFTKLTLKFGGMTLYNGNIPSGKQRENKFYHSSLSQQAFFSYFLIEDNLIAARGKGGGLALWGR
ncbi:hypothetical protein [Aphanothece sacrum]|uniref:hypothetical protein n=1 Tax=Aphanothece sacrum TaxID=1122 RepID=UPI003F65DB6C